MQIINDTTVVINNSEELKQTAIKLSVACIINGASPSAIDGRIISFDRRKCFLRIFKVVFFPVKKNKIQIIDKDCEIIVARAAPATPILNPKIKIGSRIIFVIAPIKTVSILVFAKPCALIKALRPSVN